MRFSRKCSVEFSETSLALSGRGLRGVVRTSSSELIVDETGTLGELLEEGVGEVVVSVNTGSGRDEVAGVVGEVEGRLGLESVSEGLPVVGIVLSIAVRRIHR